MALRLAGVRWEPAPALWGGRLAWRLLGLLAALAAAVVLAFLLLGAAERNLPGSPIVHAGSALAAASLLELAAARLLRRPAARRPLAVALGVALAALGAAAGVFAADPPGLPGETLAAAPASRPPAPPSAEPAPNVLFVVLDTTRADHLSLYGYPRPTTPFLARLAAEATVYERALAPAPWTLPAHASMFTGQPPSVHRATTEHRRLASQMTTLAELLRDHGWATAGFSCNSIVSGAHNLDQGFERFDDLFTDGPVEHPFTRTLTGRALLRLVHSHRHRDKGSRLVVRRLPAWLDAWAEATPRRPFFLFVNLLEAHLPYDPPEPYRGRFVTAPVRPALAPLLGSDWLRNALGAIARRDRLEEADLRQLGELYDAELAYQDAQLATLIGELERRRLLDDTLLVVVGDHGENLGEHGGLLDHTLSIHQTLLHVPLLVRYPRLYPAGLRYPAPVSTTALFASVLAAAGVPPPADRPPSVPPLPRAAGAAAPPFVVSEYDLPVFELSVLSTEVPGIDLRRWAVSQRAIQDGGFKLVRRTPGAELLYDLVHDPGELHPLDPRSRPEGLALRGALDDWIAHLPRPVSPEAAAAPLDPETRRALEALGYAD